MAGAIIEGAGLERYYREREAYAPRPDPLPEGWDAVPVEEGSDGLCEIRLHVDGLRCASCVWVTENILLQTAGVEEATVSYATGRASLRWDPREVSLASLAGTIATLGYHPRVLGSEGTPDRDLLQRLGVATFLALNIMLIYVSLYAGWFSSMEERWVKLFQWTSLALATPVALWCAVPFFTGAVSGLRHRVLHMDLPIALAVGVLYVHGVVVTLTEGHAYLDSMAMLVALLLAGRMLESRGRRKAAEAAVSLAAEAPASARREVSGGVEVVPAEELEVGDLIDVGAGEELAADGTVEAGEGLVRMAILTGEAEPVPVAPDDRVVAGSVLEDGALTVRVEAVGRETVLQQMAEQLRISADRSARPTSTDRIAPWFTAATLVVATATFVMWGLAVSPERGMTTAVAVLVVACPCALALSRPLAAAAGLGAAARRGLLFRSADALLDLVDVDTVALDKTGTVTGGDMTVLEADDDVLRIAAGLERYSSHPVARAITREAARREIPLPKADVVKEEPGVGVTGEVDGRRWSLVSGGPGVVHLRDDDSDETSGGPDAPRPEGRDIPGGQIRLGDAVRPDSRRAVQGLAELGLELVLLTGDHLEVAERIAGEAGVSHVVAEVDPAGKAEWIRTQRTGDHRVAFAGDGLNDGPGLAEADVGIAMGTGAASSILVADGVVSVRSLVPIEAGVRAARACRRAIRVNQIRSIGYNVVAVSAAAAGWINPLVAAILMPLSSAMVIWGASRVEVALK
jgi:heavy metal translocating P-type ATPase